MRTPLFAGLACAGLSLTSICGNAVGGTFTSLDDAQNGFLSSLSRNGRIAAGSYVGSGLYAGSFCWRKGVGSEPLAMTSALNRIRPTMPWRSAGPPPTACRDWR
jgi:hypothetical protein